MNGYFGLFCAQRLKGKLTLAWSLRASAKPMLAQDLLHFLIINKEPSGINVQKGTLRKKSGNYSFFYVTLFFNDQASKKLLKPFSIGLIYRAKKCKVLPLAISVKAKTVKC